ncbi:hypothetical protein AaE_007411 [Aphanomyces astaci]|uniref:Reverse transcriptase Ty1/copia-type domain-containing protein n=1 Tax=Aphanomyces astaci TaxID=112090 RepID=A0A6A5AHJ9_APHAT|nr:hypothetical protein AaE_007411 [Aphanomyces astaci]
MAQPFAHYPPQVTRHDTRNSRRAAEAATEAAAATAPTHEEGPRESRWDRSHRPSNKKKSTSPGRTKQAAVEGMDAARHQARATTVDSKRSTSRNVKVRASATTAQPTRKAGDRGQSPHKTMRTEDTRGVATKLPWQHPIDRDDPPDAANAAYDVCFNATDVDEDVSATLHEAMQSADATATGWFEACKKEIGNLEAMECYELSQVPDGTRTLKSKWVFKRKDMPDGTQNFKARVVIKGFAQRQGIDYDETYAPVIRGDSLRLSDRELYMAPPDGFEARGMAWRILGALYGLKQSALLWYQHFKAILEALDFATTLSDSCVFTRRTDGRLQIVTIYVDEVLVCASNDDEITDVFEHLQRRIRLNDLGPISKLLGMEIDRDEKSNSMYVTQRTYIERMAIKNGMDKSKRVDTPIPAGTSMVDNAGLPLDDDKPFRQIVGSLLYCAMSKRIVHAVTQLSRHLSTPHQLHMFMAKRTVAYLLHTKEVGITPTGRSTCGYLWMLACGPISWRSKLQAIITLSSTEAEYVGACLGAQHGMHLDKFMNELGLKDNGKTVTLYLDNQSAIAIGSNQSSVQRTKHIAFLLPP